MAVTIDGREPLYAEMFSAVIDSNMHDRLALNWQTPFKRSGDGVLGYYINTTSQHIVF
jgi:hypothetical protein